MLISQPKSCLMGAMLKRERVSLLIFKYANMVGLAGSDKMRLKAKSIGRTVPAGTETNQPVTVPGNHIALPFEGKAVSQSAPLAKPRHQIEHRLPFRKFST